MNLTTSHHFHRCHLIQANIISHMDQANPPVALLAFRITAKSIVWPLGLCGLIYISLSNPGSHHSHFHHPLCQSCPSSPCAPATLVFQLAVLDKLTLSLLLHLLRMFFPYNFTWLTSSHHSNVTSLESPHQTLYLK